MRQTISGAGVNTTATVLAAISAGNQIIQADLYLIGDPDDPSSLWLTNWESPLLWSWWGEFQNAVISRGNLTSKIGVASQTLSVEWRPVNKTFTGQVATTSPLELARLGIYGNRNVRIWRCLMPTPGDANTWGAMELIGGVVGDCQVTRDKIQFTINDYLYVLNEKVPTTLIEVTNTLASYNAGTPPAGFDWLPELQVVHVESDTIFDAEVITPGYSGHIFTIHALQAGYVVFQQGSSLAGLFSIIADNTSFTYLSVEENRIQTFSPFPWEPNVGDTFFISGASPIDQADGDYYGFPYVPSSATAF